MADEEILQSEVKQAEPEPEVAPQEENVAAKNFEALREAKRKIEKERDDALRKLKEMEEKKQPETHEEDDDEQDFVAKKLRDIESKLQEYQTHSAASSTEIKLRSEFKDFDSVVNKDNIDILRERYPEIADTIFSSNNLYHKAKAAYTVMKKLGIAVDDDTLTSRGKISKNLEKPRSSNSASPTNSSTPLSKLNEFDRDNLSKDEKERIYQEMKRLADM